MITTRQKALELAIEVEKLSVHDNVDSETEWLSIMERAEMYAAFLDYGTVPDHQRSLDEGSPSVME